MFPTPSREVLETPWRAGIGASKQSHDLGPRILHITALATSDARIHEVHPEVSLRAMTGGEPLSHRKVSAGGALERISLLLRHGIAVDVLDESATAPLHDVLDAGAAAWSAHRIAQGRARTFPNPPETASGRDVCIWY